jgi:hypothetical protein
MIRRIADDDLIELPAPTGDPGLQQKRQLRRQRGQETLGLSGYSLAAREISALASKAFAEQTSGGCPRRARR